MTVRSVGECEWLGDIMAHHTYIGSLSYVTWRARDSFTSKTYDTDIVVRNFVYILHLTWQCKISPVTRKYYVLTVLMRECHVCHVRARAV